MAPKVRDRFFFEGFRRLAAKPMRSLLASCILAVGTMAGTSTEAADPAIPAPADEQKTYTFGVFPYLAPLRLEAIYAPVSKALSQGVGRPVQFRTASRFELFFAKLKAGKFDIALVQPFWVVRAADEFGYLPLARLKEPLTGMIVVLEDGPIRSLEDLRGKSVATPPPYGPVTRMATRALKEHGLDPRRDLDLKGFRSVASCFQQLAIGSVSACVSGHLVKREIEENLKVKLRVLLETPGIPSLGFVVHPRVPPEDRARLLETILSWTSGDDGRAFPNSLGATGLVRAYDADYDVVRTMLREPAQQ